MGKQQVSMETDSVTWIQAAYSNLFLLNKKRKQKAQENLVCDAHGDYQGGADLAGCSGALGSLMGGGSVG